MKQYCTGIVLMLCFFLPSAAMAQQQDITGMWYGELIILDSEIVHLPYEIAVSEEKGKLTGYSRIVFHANGRDEAGVQNISIKRKGNEIIMEDEGFIDHKFTVNPGRHVKKTLTVKLSVTETDMLMEGEWNTNRTRTYRPYKGTAVLKRKNDFKKTELFKSLDTLKLADKLSFKDRPETEPTIAVVKPVEKKPEPVKISEVEPEPDLVIPAVEKASGITAMPVERKPQPAMTTITAFSKQKKMQMDIVTKTVIKPTPKPVQPPVIIAKPQPEVASVVPPKPKAPPTVASISSSKPEKKEPPAIAAATQKPEKKAPAVVASRPAPAAAKPTAPPAEKKPEPVAVNPVAKSVAPPAVIVAPSVTEGAAELDKRTTKSEQAVYFEQDSLTLTLYDNGEVDGDTVTVVMNGNIVFSKVGLTTQPNTKTIYTRGIKGDSVSLVMYAESLGEIPPNTGLMVIMDGDKRYEVRFSADLKTNAAIILRRKKNE